LNSLRFDIYLPIYYNEKDKDGNKIAVEKEKFVDTFKEIRAVFRGVSAEENAITGSWLDDYDTEYDDELTVYHVVCKLTAKNLQWLSNYQEVLAHRFRQKEIFMYYIHVYRF
jgi:hypothetical protein